MTRRDWAIGAPVRIRFGEECVKGQVWAEGDVEGTVWVALDNGKCARVWTVNGRAELVSARGTTEGVEGRVAA